MKKAVPHTTILMQCKATQVLRNLFGTNQANGSDMTFVAEATRSTSKTWKPEEINYIVMEDLNLWQILTEVLLELIR